MLCVITHAYADSVSLIPLRTLVSSADLFALMSSFLVTRRTVRCHVLSPSSSQGSQSLERQPLNPTFGNQHRHVISWASEGKKTFLRLRRCYRAVLLLRESYTSGPWSATTLSLSKAQEEGEMYLPNPLCHHHNWSLLSVCMCVAVCLCVCAYFMFGGRGLRGPAMPLYRGSLWWRTSGRDNVWPCFWCYWAALAESWW